MEALQERKIFEAIKKDDLKLFSSILISHSDLNLCYGRFPLLSLMYLYGSYKILEKYEKFLFGIKNYKVTDEYFEIYKTFKKHAKKSLKLYADKNKIVEPIEMLAILDERFILKQNYPKLYKNDEIIKNVRKIYNLNKNLEITATMNEFNCKKKRLNLFQKAISVIVASVLCACMIFGGITIGVISGKTGIGTASSPIIISNEGEFKTALKNGKKNYILKNDLSLNFDDIIKVNNFSGTIDGDGHTINFEDEMTESLIGRLTGKIRNLKINFFVLNLEINKNFAVIAEYSSGIIENCEISGTISASIKDDSNADASEEKSQEDIFVTLFAAENNGTISGCNSKVEVNIKNENERNAYYSSFAGTNNGVISNSKNVYDNLVKNKIETETVDVAGVAAINNGEIKLCENEVEISQNSNKAWHPNCAGIVITNNGKIDACKNYGNIISKSSLNKDGLTDEQKTSFENNSLFFYVFAGGISDDNFGEINGCRNYGNIYGESDISFVYAGGISAMNESFDEEKAISPKVVSSKSESEIVVKSLSNNVYAGGVCAFNSNEIKNGAFIGKITTNSEKAAYAGGISASNFLGQSILQDCYVKVSFENEIEDTEILAVYGQVYAFVQARLPNDQVYIPTYFKNNFYVNDEGKEYPAGNIWLTLMSLISFVQDAYNGCVKCNALSDVDSNLILDWLDKKEKTW